MKPYLGYFVFVNLGNGCLGAKYGDTSNTQLLTESATLTPASDNTEPYIGSYFTTWIDSIHALVALDALLIITKKRDSLYQYTLSWRHKKNSKKVYYHGEGMLYNGSLVGCYWNGPIQNVLS